MPFAVLFYRFQYGIVIVIIQVLLFFLDMSIVSFTKRPASKIAIDTQNPVAMFSSLGMFDGHNPVAPTTTAEANDNAAYCVQ